MSKAKLPGAPVNKGRDDSWLWIAAAKDTPSYSPQQVCALTGIEKHTLQNWANRGIMSPVRTREGKGGVRMYTRLQVATIALARRVSPFGVEATAAVHIGLGIFGKMLRGLLKFEGSKRPDEITATLLCTVAIVTPASKNNLDIVVFDYREMSNEQYIRLTLKAMDPAIVVPCGEIIAKLQLDDMKLRGASA